MRRLTSGPAARAAVARAEARRAAASLLAAAPAAAVLACLAALLLSACGGQAAATSPAGSPSPTPVPSPLVTEGAPPEGAVAVVREFWGLVGAGRLAEAQRSLVAPGAPLQQWTGDDVAGARFVRLVPGSTASAPPDGATVEFAAEVWVDPASGATPWGEAGTHELFESVVRMSDGSWRLVQSGTGP